MSQRKMIMLGMVVGSVAGSYLPYLFVEDLSFFGSFFCGTAGAILGIWLAWRLTR